MKCKIKKYKLKNDIKINDILNDGFEYSLNRRYLTKFTKLKGSIILYISIPLEDIYSFDFYKNIDVLDDDFCQPYMPFYDNYCKDVDDDSYLGEVIRRYNDEMDCIGIFEEAI